MKLGALPNDVSPRVNPRWLASLTAECLNPRLEQNQVRSRVLFRRQMSRDTRPGRVKFRDRFVRHVDAQVHYRLRMNGAIANGQRSQ